MKKINEYKIKQQKVNNEYENIKNKIENLILVLKGLNIENKNFNDHLINIQNELLANEFDLYPQRKRYNSISYHKIRTFDIKHIQGNKKKKNFYPNKNKK